MPKVSSRRPSLNVFAASGLDHPCLHQAAQGGERGWQVPFGQGCGLIQGIDLLLNKRKIVNGIEDHVLTVVAARVLGDDLAATADHDYVDIAADPDLTVAESDGDRVVVGFVTHQRL